MIPSSDQALDNLAADVGQPVVAAVVEIGETLVVEADQVQDRGVQVVDVGLVRRWRSAEFVGRADGHAALDAAAGHPHRETVGVVVATVACPRPTGVRPNSPPQTTSVSSSRPVRFRSVSSAETG